MQIGVADEENQRRQKESHKMVDLPLTMSFSMLVSIRNVFETT